RRPAALVGQAGTLSPRGGVSGCGLAPGSSWDRVVGGQGRMTIHITLAKLALALAAMAGLGAWAFAATPPPNLDAHESALNPGGLDTPDRPAVPLAQQGPTGNPLWGIPLRVLTATRERPLFSPSRRPPAPPAVAAPAPPPPVVAAKAPEPDHPPLTIVGT